MFSFNNVRMAGVSACIPEKIAKNIDYKWISVKERKNLIKTIGVEQKYQAPRGTATSDLCYFAAEKLLKELDWDKNSVDLLLFASQSRDYILPATACILQNRLKLPVKCAAMDIVMGCSAYNYTLSVAYSMLSSGLMKRALLLVGEISSIGSYRDKTTYPLFGDAGTATALEFKDGYANAYFNMQTDGSGYRAIHIPESGYRKAPSKSSFDAERFGKGIIRHRGHVSLDGLEVFNFSLREVPVNIKKTLKYAEMSLDDIDYYIFHQANLLMNDTIRKITKIDPVKMPYSLNKFGNTSSASIPLTMVTQLGNELRSKEMKLMMTGFGVGLSWGSNIVSTEKVVCPDIVWYESALKKKR